LGLVGSRPNVVIITADTLRADHLASYGYFRVTSPAIDRLAGEGLVFERAYAPMATTLPSHASLMTSSYPARHGIHSNLRFFHRPVATRDGFETAAQLFKKLGYTTAAFTSATPLSAASGIGAGFDHFEGPPDFDAEKREVEVSARETGRRALTWLGGASAPFFLWVHFFDPHDPYDPPQRFREQYQTTPELRAALRERGVAPDLQRVAERAVNLYDAEIRSMDAVIDLILRLLRKRGLYDDTAIVFAGDHGEGLFQHGAMRHGIVWDEQLHVPLIIKFPAGEGSPTGRTSVLASLVDVLPTLASGAGIPLPMQGFDGVDLLTADPKYVLSQREHREGYWDEPVYTLTGRRWKYHHDSAGPDRLYDLQRDPHELHDVLAKHPKLAEKLRTELLRRVAEHQSRAALKIQPELPEGVREQLRDLGYVD
jgi:arylsulfatase A-like enzyme